MKYALFYLSFCFFCDDLLDLLVFIKTLFSSTLYNTLYATLFVKSSAQLAYLSSFFFWKTLRFCRDSEHRFLLD